MREKNRLLRIHSWHHGFGTKALLFMLILFWKNFWGCQLSSRESRSVNMPTEQWWMLYDWFFFFDLESKNLIWVLGLICFLKWRRHRWRKIFLGFGVFFGDPFQLWCNLTNFYNYFSDGVSSFIWYIRIVLRL